MGTKKYLAGIIIGLTSLLYFYFFYFTSRADSLSIFGVYTILFVGYLILVNNSKSISIRWLLFLSLFLRLIPLFSLPTLSDDFYRFIWDGRLWAAGINPFAGLPIDIISNTSLIKYGLTDELFNLLNSPTHYTVYPPVPQYINWLAAKLFSDSIFYSTLLMRVFTIMAEMASITFLYLLIKKYGIKIQWLAVYAFNPLVIIELSGNLHHEALMITFILGFLYFHSQNRPTAAALMLALSVASKLLPLMFLPLIIVKQNEKIKFILVFGVTLALLFAPLLDASFVAGMKDSLSLYYQNFEFNAGIYYVLREVGYWVYDYNAIALIGKFLLLLSTGLILLFTFKSVKEKYSLPFTFTIIYLVFALLSLILHPWYILLFVALAPLTRMKFPIVWSYLIFLTYFGYSAQGFQENYYIISLEFVSLAIALVYELRNYDRSNLTLKAAP